MEKGLLQKSIKAHKETVRQLRKVHMQAQLAVAEEVGNRDRVGEECAETFGALMAEHDEFKAAATQVRSRAALQLFRSTVPRA